MLSFPPRVHAYGLPATAIAPDRETLPTSDEVPHTATPSGFLRWFMGRQRKVLIVQVLLSILWFGVGAVDPWLLGRAIDAGVRPKDLGETLKWAGLMVVSLTLGVAAGISMHTAAVAGWVIAIYRTVGLVSRKALRLGHVMTRRTPTGEVLSVAGGDADTFGATMDIFSRLCGAIFAFLLASAVVLSESLKLGLVVLIASPLLVVAATPLLRPLQRARTIERGRSSELTGMATDIVAGLRILRGIGGEQTFGDNYATQSQSVRKAGVTAGSWQAAVDALGVLLSGLLLVLLTWLGTREMLAGRLSIGQLISFFGYAVFMVWPISTFFEFAQKWIQGLVAAKKTIAVLGQPEPWTASTEQRELPVNGEIIDDASGVVIRPGRMTVIVSGVPDESSALADRIGRYLPGSDEPISTEIDEDLKGKAAKKAREAKLIELNERAAMDAERAAQQWGVTIGGVDLSQVALDEVRERILVSDTSSMVFAGTLQELVDPHGRATREQAEEVLRVASAEDVYDALPGGWQGVIEEKGRGLSGGQRQRVVLARALLAEPEVLVLVEPTSAVDAHTEARIAKRLADHRRGQTTIVTTVSPLLLHHADEVILLEGGMATARGTHHDLLTNNPAYRDIVARGMDDEEVHA